jgi:hypothetical protein
MRRLRSSTKAKAAYRSAVPLASVIVIPTIKPWRFSNLPQVQIVGNSNGEIVIVGSRFERQVATRGNECTITSSAALERASNGHAGDIAVAFEACGIAGCLMAHPGDHGSLGSLLDRDAFRPGPALAWSVMACAILAARSAYSS